MDKKHPENFDPSCVKLMEKRCKIADFDKVCGWEMARGHCTGGTGNARWPVVRFWETAPGQRAWDNSGEL